MSTSITESLTTIASVNGLTDALETMDAILHVIETRYPERRDSATLALVTATLLLQDRVYKGIAVYEET